MISALVSVRWMRTQEGAVIRTTLPSRLASILLAYAQYHQKFPLTEPQWAVMVKGIGLIGPHKVGYIKEVVIYSSSKSHQDLTSKIHRKSYNKRSKIIHQAKTIK